MYWRSRIPHLNFFQSTFVIPEKCIVPKIPYCFRVRTMNGFGLFIVKRSSKVQHCSGFSLFPTHTDILLRGLQRLTNKRSCLGTSGWVIVHLFLVPLIALVGGTANTLANYRVMYTGKANSISLGFISSFGYLLVRFCLTV